MKPLYQRIASLVQARVNCQKSNNVEWLERHTDRIMDLVKNEMPSGSGIDAGVTLDVGACTPNKLVFHFSFHHMNEHGMYSGWEDYTCIVRPSLMSGIDLRITGRNKNEIKDYLYDVFRECLTAEGETYVGEARVSPSNTGSST